MSTDQYDAAQVVRIRMMTPKGEVWSRRISRHTAERDVAGGPTHLSIEHAKGEPVQSAAIVRWTFD